MYVDLKEGLLSDAEYSHHKEIVMEDIRAIERNLSELEAPKNQTEEQITGEMKWKQMIRRFHDATEISEEMADAFIETMEIHEDGTLEIKLSYMDEFAAVSYTHLAKLNFPFLLTWVVEVCIIDMRNSITHSISRITHQVKRNARICTEKLQI